PFEELSDIGSPRVDDHEYLMMLEDPYVEVSLQAPPSPDYIPGPEEPEQAPPSPDYTPTATDQAPSLGFLFQLQYLCQHGLIQRPEVTLPPRKRLDIALGPGYKIGESSSAAAARPAGDILYQPTKFTGSILASKALDYDVIL
nr:hypothetical protein [Tanacetum cinerariifolium]